MSFANARYRDGHQHERRGPPPRVRPHEMAMLRAVNDRPMTAAQLLLSIGTVLYAPDQGRSVADKHSPRGIVLRALAYLAEENRDGVVNELRGLDRAMQSRPAEAPVSAPDESPVADGPHVAYDDDTGMVWGWGHTLWHCQADAGWHVVEAGNAGATMRTMRYVPAGSGMLEAIERDGPTLAWHIDGYGMAVPCQ